MGEEGLTITTLKDVSPETRKVLYAVGSVLVALAVVLVTRMLAAVFRFLSIFFTTAETDLQAAKLGGGGGGGKKQQQKGQAKKGGAKNVAKPAAAETEHGAAQQQQASAAPGVSLKSLIKGSKGKPKGGSAAAAVDRASHHPLFIATLKGHGDAINGVAWSADGTVLASACEDRALRLFRLAADLPSRLFTFRRKDLTSGGLVGVAFSGEPGAVAVMTRGTLNAASITLFSGGAGGPIEERWTAPNVLSKQQGLVLRGATAGPPLFMACSPSSVMGIVSGASGRLLASIETSGLVNHGAAMDPAGRLVAAATFTADVRVHEVRVDKSGAFQGVSKVMDLKGHTSQVMAIDFSPCGKRMVTASKDGTWRVWNIDVRYSLQEDPKALLTSPLPLPKGHCFGLLAYGPRGVVAAAEGSNVQLLDAGSGKVLQVIEGAHEGGPVSCMAWSPEPLAVDVGGQPVHVLATGGADRRVRLWRCPV